MKHLTMGIAALFLVVALAGCASPPPPAQGSVTSVSILRAPENAPANSQAQVCWRVQGSGSIPHTAIHTDTTSHPGNAGFDAYGGPAYYPNNASAASAVTLPGEFCTNVNVGTQDVYLRAHAMTTAPGMVSGEHRISIRASQDVVAAVTLRQYNQTAPPNSTVVVCWDLTGSGRVPHTAVHTDTVSHPAATSFADYDGSAVYPANRTAADGAGYAVPGTYCTGLTTPANGTLYFRAHAMTSPPGVISPTEGAIRVNGSAAFDGIAATVTFAGNETLTAPRGSMVTVCWRVSGTGRIPHTALHTDTTSHATDVTADFTDYKGATYYPGNETAVNTTGYATEGTVHCTNVQVPSTLGQILYIRAHALDRLGAPGKLSPNERSITAS